MELSAERIAERALAEIAGMEARPSIRDQGPLDVQAVAMGLIDGISALASYIGPEAFKRTSAAYQKGMSKVPEASEKAPGARDQMREFLVGESQWAHVVQTADGPAIEIAGQIINVRSSDPELHVNAIVSALRRTQAERVGAPMTQAEYDTASGVATASSSPR